MDKIAASAGKEGWKWVEIRPQYDYSEWSNCARRHEQPTSLPEKKQAELDRLNAELETLCQASEYSDDENPRIDKLQSKINKLTDGQERSWQPDT